jgi:hypothetical protein
VIKNPRGSKARIKPPVSIKILRGLANCLIGVRQSILSFSFPEINIRIPNIHIRIERTRGNIPGPGKVKDPIGYLRE